MLLRTIILIVIFAAQPPPGGKRWHLTVASKEDAGIARRLIGLSDEDGCMYGTVIHHFYAQPRVILVISAYQPAQPISPSQPQLAI